jgi:hypothetical protein
MRRVILLLLNQFIFTLQLLLLIMVESVIIHTIPFKAFIQDFKGQHPISHINNKKSIATQKDRHLKNKKIK